MARNSLSTLLPAYHTVLFDGVPMWRAQAWALLDARKSGQKFMVNSAIRDDRILDAYRGHGLRPGLHGQGYLYTHQHLPGFFPANPPTMTSHAGFSDGTPVFGVAAGGRLPKYKWGIDAVDRPGGDAAALVAWFNRHGYSTVRPYPTSSERHHFMFRKSPAANARKRLAAHRRAELRKAARAKLKRKKR